VLPRESRLAPYLIKAVPKRGRTTDVVTEVLKEAILDGVLPPSTWLRENELATELSVSRTPIREAFGRLAVEGLVVITANQGAMVAPMTLEDILEMYVVREDLEGTAARLAAKRRSSEHVERLEAVLGEMERAIEEGRLSELPRLNLEFHGIIRRAAGNRFVDRFLTQIEHSVRRFGRTTFEMPGRARGALEEHRNLARAVIEGDPAEAERLATAHMRRARELRIRMLAEE
jgi:DNA-binding GntR family transcriptional regulator